MDVKKREILLIGFGHKQTVTYTNHRGETRERTITPWNLYYGTTEHHPEPQWMLQVYDWEKDATRDYALSGIKVGG